MKFSRSIQFNAVPDWSDHYLAYSNLKKLIYTLEQSSNRTEPSQAQDAEALPLIEDAHGDSDEAFRRALDTELKKVCSFYDGKEKEILDEVNAVLEDLEAYKHEKDSGASPLDQSSHSFAPGRGRASSSASALAGSSGVFRSLGFGRPRRASTMSNSIEHARDDHGLEEDIIDETAQLTRSRTSYEPRTTRDDGALGGSMEDMRASKDTAILKHMPGAGHDDFSDRGFSEFYALSVALKKRIISVYVSLCELKSFIQLNKTGFSKALKKFDKILDHHLRSSYMENSVNSADPFRKEAMGKIDNNIFKVERAYADVASKGDLQQARQELRLHLREYVVWERNTVWREMIGIERKAQAARLGWRPTLLGGPQDHARIQRQGDAEETEAGKVVDTPVGRIRCPPWLFSPSAFLLLAIVVIFVVLLSVPILNSSQQQNCLAMLVFVSMLWATEVIPLFVTSLMIPFLVVLLRIVGSEEKPYVRLSAREAAPYIFSAMWTPVIMLLLGGFTIAAALSKYQIAKVMATFVLSKAGTRPRTVLLTNMFVAMVASMWISNVAAPVLSYSTVQPVLRNLPPDSEFSKALILGIALAACVGGMASPIASPQNIIALEHMRPEPSWLIWFFIALPVCFASLFLIWLLLVLTFRLSKGTAIVPLRPAREKFTGVHWFISLVSVGTILLWCVTHQIDGIVGDMGVVALIPMVLFFGTGVLTKEDFNNFLWTVVMLAAGGLALGKAVNSSGLLHTMATAIVQRIEHLSVYGVFVVLSVLILVVASFISHTVAALIVLPLAQQIGANMTTPHPNLLVMGGALMCSAAMALPTSGFPNMTAIMMEDTRTGQRYLHVKHFISRGVPSSILAFLVVISVGYGLMLIVGY
ncbi:MAG: low-affinity phosphate transporter [Lichina confinis]|nr:MAG: low-affinity phosphate transporter [Lichina confinis]